MPVGRVGAQLYPGGIAARYRNTARGLAARAINERDETDPSEHRVRAPQQPIAASFGAAVLYRGFNHWYRFPYTFLPCYRTRPAGGGPLLDRRGPLAAQRRTSGVGAALQLHPTVTAAGGEVSHPARSYGASWRRIALDYAQEELVVESVTYTVAGALGLAVDGYTIPYLASWSEDADLAAIEDAAGLIDRLAKRIEDTVLPLALDASTASEPEHDATAVTA
jgi:hypothetical protein